MHVFVSAPPKVCIPKMFRVLKRFSAQLLLDVSQDQGEALGWAIVV